MFDREKELFDELNRELKKKNIDLTVICVGGFVLSHYGFRTTHDIDGFFNASKEVMKIIKTVGDKFGINSQDELWLNNSVQNLNDPPAEGVCDILYDELSLNPVEMSKKELIEEDTNERATRIFFDRFRDRSVEKALKVLIDKLPEDMPEVEEEGFGEELLKDENGDDDDDMDVNIEDI